MQRSAEFILQAIISDLHYPVEVISVTLLVTPTTQLHLVSRITQSLVDFIHNQF